jgi:hypothetical protein
MPAREPRRATSSAGGGAIDAPADAVEVPDGTAVGSIDLWIGALPIGVVEFVIL